MSVCGTAAMLSVDGATCNVELKARDPDPEAHAGALPGARRGRGPGVLRAARHLLRRAAQAGSSSGSRTASGPELIAYRRPDCRRGEREHLRAGAGRRSADALAEALDAGAGHDGRRVEATAAVALGGRADPPGRGRGAGELRRVRGGAARRGRPRDGARQGGPSARSRWRSPTTRWCRSATRTCCWTAPEALLRAADAAMRNAYAPYSQLQGRRRRARAARGAIYAGANVENAAYPQGQCAEASALGALVAAGEIDDHRRGGGGRAAGRLPAVRGLPAAAGRSSGAPSTPVYLGRPGATPTTVTLGELLPGSFDREALEA